jgi:hypothetical protein
MTKRSVGINGLKPLCGRRAEHRKISLWLESTHSKIPGWSQMTRAPRLQVERARDSKTCKPDKNRVLARIVARLQTPIESAEQAAVHSITWKQAQNGHWRSQLPDIWMQTRCPFVAKVSEVLLQVFLRRICGNSNVGGDSAFSFDATIEGCPASFIP